MPSPSFEQTAALTYAISRLAAAIEKQAKPRNETRIRVRVLDPGEDLVELQIASPAYIIGVGAIAVAGHVGLYRDDAGDEPSRIINARDAEPCNRIRVARRALDNEQLMKGDYLVTVDQQRDFTTWRWREWLAL